jgi:UDP-N-acetylmuramoyl-tripeptide--D-alanyl-D-alanine ligase
MIRLSGEEIRAALAARVVRSSEPGESVPLPDVLAVMTDSRRAATDPAVFFALRSEHADGHDHVGAARAAGAVLAVVERPVPDVALPQLVVDDTWRAIGQLGRLVVDSVGCTVTAITGSYGKTTVKDLTAAALRPNMVVAASQGSFNNELGVPLTMLAVTARTQMLVAEAGARNAGDIATLGSLLRPDIAVVTAVGPVHLETFGDESGVAREKGRLVTALRAGGVAVLNADDPRVAAMATAAPSVLMVSTHDRTAAVHAEHADVDVDGRVRARARTPWGDADLRLPLPGAHHLGNALFALAVAGTAGVAPEEAAAGIASAPTSPSRSTLISAGGVTILDDAYNASPPTMRAALVTLAALPCEGRRWAVLGVMAELGSDAEALHREVGAACVGVVDELIVVGAEASGIAVGATDGQGAARLRIRAVEDHAAAAALITDEVRPGDAVLFKASRVATLDRAAAAVVEAREEGHAR